MCWNNFPSGLQSARIYPRSSAVKSGPAAAGVGAFAADLNDADDFSIGKNRRTDDFLNRLPRLRESVFTPSKTWRGGPR